MQGRLLLLLAALLPYTGHAFCPGGASSLLRPPRAAAAPLCTMQEAPRGGPKWGSSSPLPLASLASRRGFLMGAGAAAAATVGLPAPSYALGEAGLPEVLGVLGYGSFPEQGVVDGIVMAFRKSLDKTYVSERRPKPVKLPRTKLYRPFAVLLMRSCYEAADALDFIPMDKFQKDFFNLRSDQWEKYLNENDVKQGDLSDPKYFDFISAAQFATLTQSMADGQQIFEELTGAEATRSIVRRDPTYAQNALLPAQLYKRAGSLIYSGLLANYTGPNFFTHPPVPCPGGGDKCVTEGLTQLYTVIGENGYALETVVAEGGAVTGAAYTAEVAKLDQWRALMGETGPKNLAGQGIRIVVSMKAPCNLWGRQWLGLQGYMPTDHDIMIATEYLRRSNRPVTVSTRTTENSIIRDYVLL